MQKVLQGNNIDLLKDFSDNYFDSIVTDPPYGLGKEPDTYKLMKEWIDHGYYEIKGSGFMGKEWDAFVPQPLFWKEVFRVLKPGGHVVAFYGTRTYDWGVMAMRFAGFEVRDCIQWIYGSGFPKSHNIGIAIDKIYGNDRQVVKEVVHSQKGVKVAEERSAISAGAFGEKRVGKITKGNSEWEGWGSALKPANEPIVLARKPLEKGLSIAENVLKWGVGGININGCRIEGKKEWGSGHINFAQKHAERNDKAEFESFDRSQRENEGRFPANVILTHHPECEETIEDWNCHPECPIKIMDEQSGQSKSQSFTAPMRDIRGNGDNLYTSASGNERKVRDIITTNGHNDSGGASRFFYCAKASKSERNKGLGDFEDKQTIGGGGTYNEEAGAKYGSIKAIGKNFHPTVKPIKLMQYLARLITPPNGIVLDPFCGSGTTGVACKIEGFQFVGMEQDPEYAKIAVARIINWVEENKSELDIEEKQQLKLF